MKKSLLAIAAMGAFASAAQAQSSVTVYGILDLGYIGYNTRVAQGNSGDKAVNKTTGNSFSAGGQSTNRLGFKGAEDLGGGLSGFFTIETAITPNGSTAVSTGATGNRQTFVGLKKNGIGQFALGTQYTVVHKAVAATDPGNANNISGNLVYPAVSEGTGNSAESSTGAAYTIRTNNQLSLNSDTFAGFQGNAMIVMNNKNQNETIVTAAGVSTTTGGLNNQNGWGLGVNYTFQKFYATANYQALTSKQSAQTTAANGLPTTAAGFPQVGYSLGASAPGVNVQDNQWYLAATYDFGILKAYAQYINRKVSAQQANSYYLSRSAEQIGVRSFITPTIEAWASGGLGRYISFGSNAANLTGWQIGSNYWLSKRTNLYAIYGQTGTSNASVPTGSLTTSNANPVSGNVSNYAIGVRHTF
ncbi:porin [Polynucleobacter necessarius]|uniref:porin n=1 Tax=Polynucleobacter necessarius TaxID=576610 RepID=UPI000E095342|nr:porin [Polynucleobacter necessarius]